MFDPRHCFILVQEVRKICLNLFLMKTNYIHGVTKLLTSIFFNFYILGAIHFFKLTYLISLKCLQFFCSLQYIIVIWLQLHSCNKKIMYYILSLFTNIHIPEIPEVLVQSKLQAMKRIFPLKYIYSVHVHYQIVEIQEHLVGFLYSVTNQLRNRKCRNQALALKVYITDQILSYGMQIKQKYLNT